MTEDVAHERSARRESPLTTDAARDLGVFGWLAFVVMLGVGRSRQPSGDWSFFAEAARTLASDQWMQLYVEHPLAQTGPLTIAIAWLIEPIGLIGVRLGIMLAGIAVMALLVWSSRGLPGVRWRLAVGGTAVAVWWPKLSYYGHLDDALVLLLAVVAVVVARRARPIATGAIAGIAIGVKPTALFLLALALPRTAWRSFRSWTPLLVGVLISVVVWAPFLVADGALDALKPRVPVMPDSVVGLVLEPMQLPSGALRLFQLVTTLALAAWAHHRRGAAAVMWTGVAARLLLDPAAWPYYTAGFVLGALVWETFSVHRRIPWATILSAVLLAPEWLVESDTARAWLRLVACVGALVVVAFGDRVGERAPTESQTARFSEPAPRQR